MRLFFLISGIWGRTVLFIKVWFLLFRAATKPWQGKAERAKRVWRWSRQVALVQRNVLFIHVVTADRLARAGRILVEDLINIGFDV